MSNFHGVYLLCSINNQTVKGTYIGYTVFPGRRILQHNRFKVGGAQKTAKLAPWDMILIVHNFPNNIAALRFEWAWQNPKVSVRLKMHEWRKKRNENGVQYQIRVLEKMLNVEPWNKLPLTIQWLKGEYKVPISPPIHMPIICGPIEEQLDSGDYIKSYSGDCSICYKSVTKTTGIYCTNNQCIFHLICLANSWTSNGPLLPISGTCVKCGTEQLWGDMVQLKKKSISEPSDKKEANDWTDLLSQKS